MSSFQAILRQNAAFFDRDDHSTGTLTQMLGQEATAMSGLSGLNLGAILTVFFGIFAGVILAYHPFYAVALTGQFGVRMEVGLSGYVDASCSSHGGIL